MRTESKTRKPLQATHPEIERPIGLSTWLPAGPGFGVALLAGLYLVLAPNVNLLPDSEPYDTHRLFEIALLAGAAVWLLVSAQARAAWMRTFAAFPRVTRWSLVVVAGGGVLSSVLAEYPRYAVLEVAHFALVFVFAIVIAGWVRTAPLRISLMLVGFIALAVGLYLLGFAVVHADNLLTHGGRLWPQTSHIGFSHVRFFNQVQTWTLPLTVLPALLFTRTRWQRVLLAGLACGWWMLLFASGGRGAALGIVAAGVFVALVYRRRAWHWGQWYLASMVVGLALYGVFFAWLPSLGRTDAPDLAVEIPGTEAGLFTRDFTQDNSRLTYWADALPLVQADPVLGAGPMHYAVRPHRAAHPHNVVVQWASEWGMPSALMMLALALWGLWAWLRQRLRVVAATPQSDESVLSAALTASLVGACVHGLLSGIIVMPVSQVLLAVVVGWTCGIFFGARETENPAAIGPVRGLLPLFLVLAMVGLAWGAGPDVLRLPERQRAYLRQTGQTWLLPRYWQQGYIDYLPDPHGEQDGNAGN